MIREKRLSPRASRSESRLPLSPRRTQGSPKTTPYPPAASAERRQTTKRDSLASAPLVSTLPFYARLRSARLAVGVRLSPTARLQRKSTVCGLSGLRPGFSGSPPIKSSTRLGKLAALAPKSLCAVSTGELPFPVWKEKLQCTPIFSPTRESFDSWRAKGKHSLARAETATAS